MLLLLTGTGGSGSKDPVARSFDLVKGFLQG
jgi:hypothetical protein